MIYLFYNNLADKDNKKETKNLKIVHQSNKKNICNHYKFTPPYFIEIIFDLLKNLSYICKMKEQFHLKKSNNYYKP